MLFKTMPEEGLTCKECGSDRFDHECFDGRIPFTIFTCELCGWQVKIRDDEVD